MYRLYYYFVLNRSSPSLKKKTYVFVYVPVLHNYDILLTDSSEFSGFICHKRGFVTYACFPGENTKCGPRVGGRRNESDGDVKIFVVVHHNRRLRNVAIIKCIR